MTPPRSFPLCVLLGVLLLQAAWILTVPPFRAIDEFDHAYRAASVARGEWLVHGGESDRGRGRLVTVPDDIVAAAHPQCSRLRYTKHDNCNPAERLGDGQVRVATAASRYTPLFYWYVGTVARPFHGDGALYAMRAAVALLCALGIAACAWVLQRRRAGWWPRTGLVLALTPVLLYSTTIPAGNGPEMVAGLLLWTSLLCLPPAREPGSRRILALAVVAAVLLLTLRSLGPLFALAIVVCVVLVRGRETRDVLRAHARGLAVGTLVCLAAAVASVAWLLVQQPLGSSTERFARLPYSALTEVVTLGFLQSIAAAPLRDVQAPTVVYVVYAAALLTFLVVVLAATRGARRLGFVVALLLTQLIPVGVSALGLHSVGLIWQGRYGLPFAAGVAVLGGVLLDASGRRPVTPRVAVTWVVAVVLAQVVATAAVIRGELADNPASRADHAGWLGSVPVVALLALLGAGLLARALVAPQDPGRAGPEPDAHDGRPVEAEGSRT